MLSTKGDCMIHPREKGWLLQSFQRKCIHFFFSIPLLHRNAQHEIPKGLLVLFRNKGIFTDSGLQCEESQPYKEEKDVLKNCTVKLTYCV